MLAENVQKKADSGPILLASMGSLDLRRGGRTTLMAFTGESYALSSYLLIYEDFREIDKKIDLDLDFDNRREERPFVALPFMVIFCSGGRVL